MPRVTLSESKTTTFICWTYSNRYTQLSALTKRGSAEGKERQA